MLHNYKGIKVLHIYNAHYFQEKTKFEKVAKMLHNYRVSVIIDVQHYRSATRCTTIRLIRKVGTKRDKHNEKEN